jgi:hypothetical protein
MSALDTLVPLLRSPWTDRTGISTSTVPLPGVQRETLAYLESQWSGFLTAEMRQVLQLTCGLSGTPLGNIDFTGRWYPEEPLCVFRPSVTLTVDTQGRRWVAEAGRIRGLPGPVWCILPAPKVALFVERNLGEFLLRLQDHVRRGSASEWLSGVSARARKLWACRYARATALPIALGRFKEIRAWLARLPLNAWIYDLRAPVTLRGLPYGLAPEPGHLLRCGRLPVFAVLGTDTAARNAVDELWAEESVIHGEQPELE